ncbi:hypothetical protein SAMN00790413_01015 [Deinococcus hopiensis KR-140]|uniref:Uncharacterized protein n=1 Tax=Deinococcus hopiensis KR-140 TaxID=695939 RepID=A0A1W1VCX3_9DEIO|nr:hypothetical protein SAMN00790413_01015 [Deinococcus hopiensis KR-140]
MPILSRLHSSIQWSLNFPEVQLGTDLPLLETVKVFDAGTHDFRGSDDDLFRKRPIFRPVGLQSKFDVLPFEKRGHL